MSAISVRDGLVRGALVLTIVTVPGSPEASRFGGRAMAIRHVITVHVAPGKAADFAGAFKVVQAIAHQEEGCEQYELFQSLDDPDRLVLLERWTNQELLDKHMAAERTRDSSPMDALVALWAPGVTPTIERFDA
jgi:quinol monooxygenase YgiN